MSEKLSPIGRWRNILNIVEETPLSSLSLEEFEKMSVEQQERILGVFAHFNPGVYVEAMETEWEVSELK